MHIGAASFCAFAREPSTTAEYDHADDLPQAESGHVRQGPRLEHHDGEHRGDSERNTGRQAVAHIGERALLRALQFPAGASATKAFSGQHSKRLWVSICMFP